MRMGRPVYLLGVIRDNRYAIRSQQAKHVKDYRNKVHAVVQGMCMCHDVLVCESSVDRYAGLVMMPCTINPYVSYQAEHVHSEGAVSEEKAVTVIPGWLSPTTPAHANLEYLTQEVWYFYPSPKTTSEISSPPTLQAMPYTSPIP